MGGDEIRDGLIAAPVAERDKERQGCCRVRQGLLCEIRGQSAQGGALAGARRPEQRNPAHLAEGLEEVLVIAAGAPFPPLQSQERDVRLVRDLVVSAGIRRLRANLADRPQGRVCARPCPDLRKHAPQVGKLFLARRQGAEAVEQGRQVEVVRFGLAASDLTHFPEQQRQAVAAPIGTAKGQELFDRLVREFDDRPGKIDVAARIALTVAEGEVEDGPAPLLAVAGEELLQQPDGTFPDSRALQSIGPSHAVARPRQPCRTSRSG